MNVFGTLISGWATDRWHPGKILYAITTTRIVLLCLLLVAQGKSALFLFCVGFGFTNFALVPVINVLVTRMFEQAAASRIFGWAAAFHQAGSAVGAVAGAASLYFDKSFVWAIVACIVFSGYSLVFVRFLMSSRVEPLITRRVGNGSNHI